MKKDLNYYLQLPYKIEVVPIPPEDGGGYEASLPEIGRFAIVGDGETPAEAIADLERIKAEQFRHYLEKGTEIPEPSPEKYGERFIIRFPAALHQEIVLQSKESGISPDEFILQSLSSVLGQRYGQAAGR
jgi:predicted HicB family RNase H-like nuclease